MSAFLSRWKLKPGFIPSLQISSFSREQTEILKGIGILLIVLHNFYHNLTPLIGQNEFVFHSKTITLFLQTIVDNPLDILRAIFSYFGHYGVQIFIFFSAYGLTKKYYEKNIKFNTFLHGRINKIYLSFLLCLVVYILLGLVKTVFLTDEKVLYWDSLLWKALLLSNLIPNQAMMPVGPWWFLPFIFQFYVLYPFLLKGFQKYGGGFLLIISIISIFAEFALNPILVIEGLNLNYMVFGHLPLFCLGMYLAVQDRINIRMDVVVISLVLFVLGNFNSYLWILSDFTFTILFLAGLIFVFSRHSEWTKLSTLFTFFGGISFYLFMVNGFLRSPFHNFAESYNLWWVDNLAALASLLFSTLFAMILLMLDKRLRIYFKI